MTSLGGADALLDELRADYVDATQVHLNAAGVSPLSPRCRATALRIVDVMARGTFSVPALLAEYELARATFARLVGVETLRLAFFQTCAAALSQAAHAIPLAAGDEVVLLDQEYPSNAYPWHRAAERAGASVRIVPSRADFTVDEGRFLEAIGERTRVVALSLVQFQTGTVLDIAAVVARARAVDAWVVVDAIQGLGVLPFDQDALGIDLVAGGTHKWLLGPIGHGFLGVSRRRLASMEPLLQGAITYGTPDDAVDPLRAPRKDARRFEPGTPMLFGAIAGAASIEHLLSIGVDRVHREALAIADLVVTAAQERGARMYPFTPGARRSPIVTFVPRGDVPATHARLLAHGIAVGQRGGGVRVAPHAFNIPRDVERMFAVLGERD